MATHRYRRTGRHPPRRVCVGRLMSFTTSHRNGFTTARCDNPRCGHEFTWRGPTDSPPVGARNALRGHVCPNWRHGQVSQEGGAA